jgi:DNA-binding MarR family transcriptional regulator
MPSQENTIEQIMACFRQLGHDLSPLNATDWLELDLTMAQLKALFVLAGNGRPTVGEVGQMLRIQLPAASYTVDRLVRLELARRCEDAEDRRRTFVDLTPRGQALVERLRDARRDVIQRRLAELSPEDLGALLQGLQSLAAAIARHADELRSHEQGSIDTLPSHQATGGPVEARKTEEETECH